MITFQVELIKVYISREGRQKLEKVNWEKFQELSENQLKFVRNDQNGGSGDVIAQNGFFCKIVPYKSQT